MPQQYGSLATPYRRPLNALTMPTETLPPGQYQGWGQAQSVFPNLDMSRIPSQSSQLFDRIARSVMSGEDDPWLDSLGVGDELPTEYNLARNRPDIQQAMLQPSARQFRGTPEQIASRTSYMENFQPTNFGGGGQGGGQAAGGQAGGDGEGDMGQPDIRDLQAFRYWSNLGNRGQNRNQVSPLFSALVGNQVGGLLNYGQNVTDPVNRAYDLQQIAAAMTAGPRAQRDIAKIASSTELMKSRDRNRTANKLIDTLMSGGLGGLMGMPTGMQTDYGAGVQNPPPMKVIRNQWQNFRR